ncbi:hypothetical protein HC022_09715 [Salipiger sp. HF18]|uniref:Flp pilus assembly protein, pilin Flp n=1 Tax=Salipiger thiooxidans TaxID=282683 RepID=A0A1G7AQY3_9RHOB|nr:hypothetical protein [Salipiger sp.]NIY96514.1 hypothetical protein [Salipiger sp. HF18]SDE17142.1 hypothetical protein SAMN04488105_101316 [Salipiger thiooxidans]
MVRVFRNFLRSDSGAVTVDWVVLTASVVFMAAISFYQIRDSSGSMEEATASALAAEQTSLFPE